MRTVATEMEREGMTLPLLIGGATTSRAHTAVSLEPAYSGPVVHVQDASRAVGVVRALLDENARDDFVQQTRAAYEELRRQFADRDDRTRRLTIAEARANRLRLDWSGDGPAAADLPWLAGAARHPARGAGPSASTGRRSSPPGSCPATTRRSSTTSAWARPRDLSSTTRRRC